jgi:hypothetical protein
MSMPNFLIIGAAKSGTTAVYHCLKQHPQIYMSPVEEPYFFAFVKNPPAFWGPGTEALRRRAVVRLDDYQALFEGVTTETALGEASAIYLSSYYPDATAQSIGGYIPHVRLIAILHQPADRAYARFVFNRLCNDEPLANFRQVLAEEPARIRANWRPGFRYQLNGFYYANIRPYFERFPREQIRVYLYDDWLTNPRQVLHDIFGFLGVDDTFRPNIAKQHDASFMPRSSAGNGFLRNSQPLKTFLKPVLPQTVRHKLISILHSFNQKKIPPLEPELRRQLTDEYRDDILKL